MGQVNSPEQAGTEGRNPSARGSGVAPGTETQSSQLVLVALVLKVKTNRRRTTYTPTFFSTVGFRG